MQTSVMPAAKAVPVQALQPSIVPRTKLVFSKQGSMHFPGVHSFAELVIP